VRKTKIESRNKYMLSRTLAASETDLPRAIKLPRVNVTPNFTGWKKTSIDWNNGHEKYKIIHKGSNVGKYKVIITD
jgi:hypothetical protein